MRVTVIGQKPGGPVLQRTASPVEFFEGWGPWALYLWQNARRETLLIEGHKIRVVVR